MNIDEYRALKAEEETQASQPVDQVTSVATPTETTIPVVETSQAQSTSATIQTEGSPDVSLENTQPQTTETPTPTLPDKITIDGLGEVTIDELKNGYLRQSDYTRKTQEVSRKSKEVDEAVVLFEHLKQNPQLAQQLLQTKELPPNLDPTQSKVMELEEKLYDMMLEKEIETLQSKYPDFEIKDVLEIAESKKMTNLEDAYFLSKSNKPVAPQNMEEVKKQIRQELLLELENERKSTKSIITDGGDVSIVQENAPTLSESEMKVSSMMGMKPEEYIKWRDIKPKRVK